MTLSDFFFIPFEAGGREYSSCDCWGWVRLLRHDVYGKRLMPKFPGTPVNNRVEITTCYQSLTEDPLYRTFTDVSQAEPGTVVAIQIAGLCTHVGVVVEDEEELYYADTSATGTRRTKLTELPKMFSSRLYTVVFIDDKN